MRSSRRSLRAVEEFIGSVGEVGAECGVPAVSDRSVE